jgi:hypothetical protein
MEIFENEKTIAGLVLVNKISYPSQLIEDPTVDIKKLNNICQGNACTIASLAPKNYKPTDDVTPISSILVTDIWNANNDVFTSEEILGRYETAKFKPINWMHKGSEDTENENIGVMLDTTLVYGDIPEINIIKGSEDIQCDDLRSCSGKVHIKQDGIIWSGYFPTYASKINKGIKNGTLFVSMECFFDDFGYALRKNEDSSVIFVDRTSATSKMSKDLTAFGGSGYTKYNGEKYQVGRWLKKITFSGQGVVYEPANKTKNKINSIIFANLLTSTNPLPTIQEPNTILNTNEMPSGLTTPGLSDDVSNLSRTDTPESLRYRKEMPTTYQPPKDGFLFFTPKEAESVGKIKLGCTGYHLYQENRHGDKPLLYSALIADPSDLEKQVAIPQYRPCADERELRFAMDALGLSTETETSYYIDKPEGTSQLAVDDEGNKLQPCGTKTFDPKFPTCIVSYNETTKQCIPTGAPTNQNNPNCNEFIQSTQGQENTMRDITKQLSENLIKNKNKVYDKREENMSEQNGQIKIEKVLAENKQLTEQVFYAEKAIDLATQHISKINASLTRLAALEDFKAQADAIIDEAYDNKIAEERLTTMKEIVGESYNEEDLLELKAMSEDSFEELKKAVSKVSRKIEEKITEQEIIVKATAAIKEASKNKQVSPAFVLESTPGKKEDAAKTLITHALRRR